MATVKSMKTAWVHLRQQRMSSRLEPVKTYERTQLVHGLCGHRTTFPEWLPFHPVVQQTTVD